MAFFDNNSILYGDNATVAIMTGAAYSDFIAYSRPLIIFKEPIQNITILDQTPYGYNNTNNITYTQQSGVFQAKIVYGDSINARAINQGMTMVPQANIAISNGKAVIKVLKDARDYLMNGKVESVQIDGNTFNKFTIDGVANYIGFVTYIFRLERTL